MTAGSRGRALAREYERLRDRRERRVLKRHPHLGGLILAWTDEPQPQKAFRQGERGERAVAESVVKAVGQVQGRVLHNRRMPGGRGDIDHIAVVPSGIHIIDAKAVRGTVEIRRPWFTPAQLFIAGRDRTTYLDGLDRQVDAVRDVLDSGGSPDVPLHAALCFTEAELPLLRTVEVRGHLLMYRRALTRRLIAPGPLTPSQCAEAAARLATGLRLA